MAKVNDEFVRELLSPFSDAGTELEVISQANGFSVKGQRRFQPFAFELQQHDGGSLVVPKTRREVPLTEHLASGAFADLDRLARSMLPFLKRRLVNPANVVDGRISEMKELDSPAARETKASDAVSRVLYESSELGTEITFLHGDAGAGKSWLLMNIALQQAQDYLARKRKQFPLYVDAQGVNLRSISQQISYQLDVYNGVLRYTEVTPLVRLGALGLIIDGFDELIMPSGYNDTLRALMSYVEDFKGEGCLLASARTSFLHAYASGPLKHEPSYPYHVHYVRLDPWTQHERADYANKRGRPELAEDLENLAGAASVNRELLGRPFLVAHTFGMLQSGADIRADALLATVEDAFIERERSEKLRDLDTNRPLLSREQFESLMEEVAEEMWLLRQNSLDRQTARTVAGLVAESYQLSRSERELLEQKIDTHYFLEVESGGRIRFPHEIIFSRILAKRIARWMKESDFHRAAALLRIAPIKTSMAEQFVSLVSPDGAPTDAATTSLLSFAKLAASLQRSGSEANVRLNASSLIVYLLPKRLGSAPIDLTGLHLSSPSFDGANLANITFSDCLLQDIDARGADWSTVSFVNCYPIDRMLVDRGQELPQSLPGVSQLHVFEASGFIEKAYGTGPTRELLFGKSAARQSVGSQLSPEARSALEVLEDLCKKTLQGHHWFPLEGGSEARFRAIRRNPQWRAVIEPLERNGLLVREKRQRRGPNAELAHLRRSGEILAALGGDRATREIETLIAELREL